MTAQSLETDTPMDRGARLRRLALAAGILVCCFALCAWRGEFLYLTNDDASVQSAMASALDGGPLPLNLVSRIVSTAIVAPLYMAIPTVQWWHVYSVALLGMGALLLTYAILLLCGTKKTGLVAGALLGLVLNLVLFAFPLCRVSFTTVPAVLGAGVLAWYFATPYRETLRVRVACVALFVLAISHRQASGLVPLCFFVLVVVYAALRQHGFALRSLVKALPFLAVLGCVAAIMVFGGRALNARVNSPEFQEFNSARIRYMDYPHDSYEQNPALYEEVGWDETLYRLVDDWCFMDDRVNAQTLSHLSKNSTARSGGSPSLTNVREALDGIQDNDVQAKVCIAAWGVTTLVAFVSLALGRDRLGLVTLLLCSLATLALLGYQYVQGRILYRSLFVILAPSIAVGALLLARRMQDANRARLSYAAVLALCVLMLPLAFLSLRDTFDRESADQLMGSSAIEENINRYAIAHKPTVFVRHMGVASCTDPGALYPYDKPTNVFPWGGSQFGSNSFEAKLQKNDLDDLDGSVFRDKGALFVSSTNIDELDPTDVDEYEDNLLVRTLRWQQERYGATGMHKVDDICDGAYVYQFEFGE
ncbi:MAG: hypothetical protein Q4A01_01500 [Coriobacteriales bacterium]|nr:hypothetical protein [Coriobacteriales bacterium]